MNPDELEHRRLVLELGECRRLGLDVPEQERLESTSLDRLRAMQAALTVELREMQRREELAMAIRTHRAAVAANSKDDPFSALDVNALNAMSSAQLKELNRAWVDKLFQILRL